MSIHSLSSLSQKKQYVHFIVPFLNKIRKLFGPSLSSAWEVFYTESRATHGVIRRTYDYLAEKIGCSRRTVIRYVKRMVKAGILIVNKRFHHQCNLENEFILLTPEEALISAENAPDRARPDLDIDYSVNYLVENPNSVDKSVTSCHPSILTLNPEINITEAAPIIGFCQEENKELVPKVNLDPGLTIYKSVPSAVVNKVKKFISGQRLVSSPAQLLEEAIYFIATQKLYSDLWAAYGAFVKLFEAGIWRTPRAMKYSSNTAKHICG